MNKMTIQSKSGPYSVLFVHNALELLKEKDPEKTQLIVDSLVYKLYKNKFDSLLSHLPVTLIDALETNKNVDKTSYFVNLLMKNTVKLDHTLVAIGGGIIQDITCFLASTLFRGMKWEFVPTTLLAQADSCIGSKSSINVGEFKNLMGTFYPPQNIFLDVQFLNTLEEKDINSGIGEIFKVHMIKGKDYFLQAAQAYGKMKTDKEILQKFIFQSLEYKKEKIELDEYDKGPRNVMNYGHSFGHAIEAATHFAVPHGIAVTMGMDMANHQSYKMGRISEKQFLTWHELLKPNYINFSNVEIPIAPFISAIAKDKKNTGADLSLILVRDQGDIEKVKVKNDEIFEAHCSDFFRTHLA